MKPKYKIVGFYTDEEKRVRPRTRRRRARAPATKPIREVTREIINEKLDKMVAEKMLETKRVKPIVVPDKSVKRVAANTSSGTTPVLHPAKVEQRKALADQIKKKGTILELHGGSGNLTKEVYAPKAKKVVRYRWRLSIPGISPVSQR